MAYSEELAQRVRNELKVVENVNEKEMMGGLTFMVNDKMCVGIIKDELMCRVHPDAHEDLIQKLGCRTMDFTAKPMKGYLLIDETGLQHAADLKFWINEALAFNPLAKSSKKKKK